MDSQAGRMVQAAPARLADELADAAHELKTPIAIALALCASASEDDGEALRDDIRRIERHVRALGDQLEALLDPARREVARAPQPAPADLVAIVREATGTFDAVAAQRGVRLAIDVREPVTADVDADRLAMAVRNLVSNAVRHARAGGVVRTTIVRDGAWARIEVADDGPGVPQADRETVFERHRRLERDARVHPGSGLGLAIVRDVAVEHGGRVEVRDAPEGGALFAVELPLMRDAARPFRRHLRALERAASPPTPPVRR